MRDPIRAIQARDIVGRGVVDEAAILGPHEYALRGVEVRSATIHKSRARLSICSRDVFGIEDESTSASQSEGRDALQREPKDISR